MGTVRTRVRLLCMGFAVLAAVACGDDDDGGDGPEAGSSGDGGVAAGRGGSSGGGSGSGGRSGAGGRGGTGGRTSTEVTLDGCCTAERVCGYISTLRMACITQSDLLDPPISAGPACDGADADGGAADEDAGTDEGLPPVDPDCPTYMGTYTPAGP